MNQQHELGLESGGGQPSGAALVGPWPWGAEAAHLRRRGDDGIRLRAAEPGDAAGLTVLANLPLYRAGTLRQPFHSEAETSRSLTEGRSGHIQIVAEIDGVIVGSAGLLRHSGRRLHAAQLGLGVHDAYQRRGIGRAMLGALLDAGFNWLQLRRIELTVFTDNDAAIALYQAHGFSVEGLHRGYAFRNGADADVLAMALLRPDPVAIVPLGPATTAGEADR
ncbi:GNAT family N-acetyltransferase [Rhizobium sp. YIM 134829]|uniref:GNAT family N-acetyltransferase n=1 Tax=Rhizobium sp. YIM 134829 TaxID=3390453 RepID=UPI00397DEB8F